MSYYKVLSITIIFFVVGWGVYLSGGFEAGAAFLQSISPRFGSSSATYNLSNGLVGHWTFDGRDTNWNTNTTADVSGNGNTATIVNMSTGTAPVVGKLGQGLLFDATNDYVTAGSPASLDDIVNLTACAWINPRSAGKLNGSFHFGEIVIKQASAILGGWFLEVNDRTSPLNVTFYRSFSSTDGSWRTPANAAPLNTWSHVCVTYNNSSTANVPSIYVNGVSQSLTTVSTPIGTRANDSAGDLQIGDEMALDETFDGAIDDVRVYNRMLSADEIKQLYLQGSTLKQSVSPRPNSNSATYGVTNGLVGYWTFDGRDTSWSANTTADVSGNGNTGTMTNMSTGTAPTIGKMGQGFLFDGSNDYVAVSGPAVGASHTFAGWIKPGNNSSGSYHMIVGDSGAFNGLFMMSYNSSRCSFAYRLNYYDGADHCSNTTLNDNGTWYHVAAVVNANALTYYLNGQTDGTATLSTSYTVGAIGSDTGAADPFNGTIDDLRIYNRALTADEIKQLYLQGSTLKQSVSPRPNSNPSTYGLSNGLVGYWTFDGRDTNWNTNTTADVSGNGNTGTMTNMSTSSAPAPGRFGQGLLFDNSDDYVSTALTTHYAQTSISAWVLARSGGASGLARIVEKRTGGAQTFLFYYEDVNGDIAFNRQWTGGGSDGAGNAKWTIGTLPSYNTWHHLVVTYDESSASNLPSMYTDGVPRTVTVVVAQPSGSVVNNSDPYVIGNRGDTTRAFDGIIDDVRIYNRILTADEVKQLYLMGR